MGYNISGIQQVGLGNASVYETWEWYRLHFGMDLPVFDEAAEAGLMLPYTDGKPQQRHAVLALNYNGGGGMEIWQYTSRTPVGPKDKVQYGDLGILCSKFKVRNVAKQYTYCKDAGITLLSEVSNIHGVEHFFAEDPWGNLLEVCASDDWFNSTGHNSGGIGGASLGVTDMDRSIIFYSDILGYDKVVSDVNGTFEDLSNLHAQGKEYRRVLLTHSQPRKGAFSRLLGATTIELVQCLDRSPQSVFEGRLWGDLGYIHLCFDINGMEDLKSTCEAAGHPFTVDSANSFDMGEAAGRFAYIEDPDGTLIEFVEAHKIPIIKKVNWYLHLDKRDPKKSLPNYFFAAMALNRKKSPVA